MTIRGFAARGAPAAALVIARALAVVDEDSYAGLQLFVAIWAALALVGADWLERRLLPLDLVRLKSSIRAQVVAARLAGRPERVREILTGAGFKEEDAGYLSAWLANKSAQLVKIILRMR